jgi:ElaA protein
MTFKLWSVGAFKSPESHATVWRLMSFEDLRVGELYELLRLRSEVFVVEQQCVYLDIDGDDRDAHHLLGVQGDELKAYARCFGPGKKFAEASIGRVVTHPTARGSGLGHALMAQAVAAVSQVWGPQAIRIGAQAHLTDFYAKHGFLDVGRPYIEDDIAHLEMLRPAV